MMTFKQFVSEQVTYTPEEFADKIIQDCSEFLNEQKVALYRGIKNNNLPYRIYESRSNRQPKDMEMNIHAALDSFFIDEFGIPFRSEGYFCATGMFVAKGYGDVHIIFPSDGYNMISSGLIDDAYTAFGLADGAPYALDPILADLGEHEYERLLSNASDPKYHQHWLDFGKNVWPKMIVRWLKKNKAYSFVGDLREVQKDHEIMIVSDRHYAVKMTDSGSHFEVLDIIAQKTGWGDK